MPQKKRRRDPRNLLAEDNIINQQVAAAMLEKLGLRADMSANGEEALQALANFAYDLVLMDVQMPVMDGITATKAVRKMELGGDREKGGSFTSHLPIIAMTANAVQGDREDCLLAGMDDFLQKPVSLSDLEAMLEKWLPTEPAGSEEAPAPAEQESRPLPSDEKGNRDGGSSPNDASASDVAVWDRAILLQRMSGDEELEKRMLESFLMFMPQQITALRTIAASGDVAAAERQAHSIKGAAANVGGEAMRAVAAAMETASHAEDLASINARLDDLERAYTLLKDAVCQVHKW